MTPSSEEDEFLRVAFAAIPRITEMIAAFPPEHRAGALEVAKWRYMRAAKDFGCTTADAERAAPRVRVGAAKVANSMMPLPPPKPLTTSRLSL